MLSARVQISRNSRKCHLTFFAAVKYESELIITGF